MSRADAWWAWHDQDSARWSPSVEEAERRCAEWLAGGSNDGPAGADISPELARGIARCDARFTAAGGEGARVTLPVRALAPRRVTGRLTGDGTQPIVVDDDGRRWAVELPALMSSPGRAGDSDDGPAGSLDDEVENGDSRCGYARPCRCLPGSASAPAHAVRLPAEAAVTAHPTEPAPPRAPEPEQSLSARLVRLEARLTAERIRAEVAEEELARAEVRAADLYERIGRLEHELFAALRRAS